MHNLYAANLESPLTENLTSISILPNAAMNLCAGSDQLRVLQSAGFDVLTANNNHQDDCSAGGILQTNQLLESAGFLTLHEANGVWMKELPEKDLVFIGVNAVGTEVDEAGIIKNNQDAEKCREFCGDLCALGERVPGWT